MASLVVQLSAPAIVLYLEDPLSIFSIFLIITFLYKLLLIAYSLWLEGMSYNCSLACQLFANSYFFLSIVLENYSLNLLGWLFLTGRLKVNVSEWLGLYAEFWRELYVSLCLFMIIGDGYFYEVRLFTITLCSSGRIELVFSSNLGGFYL